MHFVKLKKRAPWLIVYLHHMFLPRAPTCLPLQDVAHVRQIWWHGSHSDETTELFHCQSPDGIDRRYGSTFYHQQCRRLTENHQSCLLLPTMQ